MTNLNPKPIAKYLETKDFREHRLWVMRDGKLMTRYNGLFLTDLEFDRLHPVQNPVTFKAKREDIDSTHYR